MRNFPIYENSDSQSRYNSSNLQVEWNFTANFWTFCIYSVRSVIKIEFSKRKFDFAGIFEMFIYRVIYFDWHYFERAVKSSRIEHTNHFSRRTIFDWLHLFTFSRFVRHFFFLFMLLHSDVIIINIYFQTLSSFVSFLAILNSTVIQIIRFSSLRFLFSRAIFWPLNRPQFERWKVE